MQNTIDAAGQGVGRSRRKDRDGSGTVDRGGAYDETLSRKTAGKIAGAIGAGKIEERGPAFDALGHKACKVTRVAIGRRYIDEARSAHRLRGAPADRKYR